MNARSRKDARLTLDTFSKAIVTHMLKIILFPQGAVNHWENELQGIAAILRGYHRSKGPSGENYSRQMFREYLYDDMKDALPLGFVDEFSEEYGEPASVNILAALARRVDTFYDNVTTL